MSETGRTRWGTKLVLVALAAACGGGAWYAREQEPVAGAKATAEARTDALSYLSEDLPQALRHWAPGDAPDKLRTQLDHILADSDVTAVRFFDAEGTLVFSSIAGEEASVDPVILEAALGGETVDGLDATTAHTYSMVDGLVGEIQQDAAEIRGTATLPWTVGQFVGIGLVILFLGSALFAGNGTKAPKVRAAAASTGLAKQTKKELDGEDPEIAKLRAKAEKAEQSRRAMEDQLNMLRSQILSGDAGSQARIGELEGHLQDAHNRVTDAETRNTALTLRTAELEASAAGSEPVRQRLATLETEVTTSKARTQELEALVGSVEARAVQAETTAAAHAGQIEEAHVKARQADLRLQETTERASAAEQRAEELQARLQALETNGHGADEQVQRLQAELASSGPSVDERERVLQDAIARADSAEQLLSAAETRVADATARASEAEAAARVALAEARVAEAQAAAAGPTSGTAADPVSEESVRELEIALADARAAAWAAEPEDDGRPSLGVVETHAVPEGEDAQPEVLQEMDEASAIRAELERMGQIVEHAGEAGDVEGLRGRLAQTAARKKGRSGVEDRISRSS